MGQGHETKTWDKGMVQGHVARAWGKGVGQVPGEMAWDTGVGKGHGKGYKGRGKWHRTRAGRDMGQGHSMSAWDKDKGHETKTWDKDMWHGTMGLRYGTRAWDKTGPRA